MQEVVDVVNQAAKDTGSFGRVEDSLIQSAKDKDYPLHYAYERNGTFDKAYREPYRYDATKSAQFAIVAKREDDTFSDVEALYKSVVKAALDAESALDPVDFSDFDAQMGGTDVRIGLYEMTIDTDFDVNP